MTTGRLFVKADAEFNYGRYLASREWALLKEAVKARSGGICERCGKAPHRETHHLTYERVGIELLEDLQGVCRPCHAYLSGKSSLDPATPRQEVTVVDPGAAAIIERFAEISKNLPLDAEAVDGFNAQIQAVILQFEKTHPRMAVHLAQIKLEANRRFYNTSKGISGT